MSVRPRTTFNVSPGGGRVRCGCCRRLFTSSVCEDAVMSNEEDNSGAPCPVPPAEPQGEEVQVPEEETRPRKEFTRPELPTQAEIDRHRIDHLPYRNWCPECIEGFGRERAHHAKDTGERDVPLVVCDYLFINPRGGFDRTKLPEAEQGASCRVLVVKCANTKCLFAHAVL